MVFNKIVDINQIKEFETRVMNKVLNSNMIVLLNNEAAKKKLNLEIFVQHTNTNLKSYCSHLVINVFDEMGARVYENDEPNCCIMLCEVICFVRNGHIIGVDLCGDKVFNKSLALLINKIEKYNLR